jgi:hypothetical protein
VTAQIQSMPFHIAQTKNFGLGTSISLKTHRARIAVELAPLLSSKEYM